MDGAVLLLLFSAFLVFVTYRMDQNDKRHEEKSEPYEDILKRAYMEGFNAGKDWNSSSKLPSWAIRKKRK